MIAASVTGRRGRAIYEAWDREDQSSARIKRHRWHGGATGQLGARLGAWRSGKGGVLLGLAVDELQAPSAVAAPGRAGGATLAVHPPRSQPITSQPAGDASTSRQPTKSTDRANHGRGNADKGGDGRQDKPSKDKPGKGKPGTGKPVPGKHT
jgi:hypothetical protein